MLICEASVTLQGAGGEQRSVSANELFQDYLETAVGPTEVLTEIRMPVYDGWGYGYSHFRAIMGKYDAGYYTYLL